MYLSHLAHPQPPLPAVIERALAYLRVTDFAGMEPGRFQPDGEAFTVIIQTPLTQPWETGLPEYHERNLDIQYLLEGEEVMGFAVADATLPRVRDEMAERDIAFVAAQPDESRLVLKPGMFAIFFPGELHKPCRSLHQSQPIRKVVIKIDATLLTAV
ncbi:YhcH/YjgK/YiaL family protein [Chitinibacteraceae bacterium HSL-7]